MMAHNCSVPHGFTYADYQEWSGPYGEEVIDGVWYVREPSPSLVHQEVAGELYRQLKSTLDGKPCRVFVAPFDVLLPKGKEKQHQVNTVVQPDVFIVCDKQKINMHGVVGAPDWIAEVLSPSTARYDKRKKVPRYERAGVRELWLVDAFDRKVTRYLLKEGRYGRPTTVKMKGKTRIAAVSGVTVDWDDVFKHIDYYAT